MKPDCSDCFKPRSKCTCGHQTDACPSLFIDDEGWLRRCWLDPWHEDDCHDDGEWSWSTEAEIGLAD